MLSNKFLRFLVLSAFVATLAACGGGGDGDDGDGGSGGGGSVDVSGTWTITETMGSNTCGDPVGASFFYTLTATLSGNSLTVQVQDGRVFNGTVDGDRVQWSGSYAEDGGTTTIDELNVTVSSDGNSLSGSNAWSWAGGGGTCSGTTSVSGTRTAT
jgi:hypothetical protein